MLSNQLTLCNASVLTSSPYSVHQGMFLSPITSSRENLFWSVMRDATWISLKGNKQKPKRLADTFLRADYDGPFELIFYCYYAFPTDLPEHISKIFGEEYFRRVIESEAMDEFKHTIQKLNTKSVVTFNTGIFNLVSKDRVERCTDRLLEGGVIQGQINGIDYHVPIFLTCPMGWRYHKQSGQFRKASLDAIRKVINKG